MLKKINSHLESLFDGSSEIAIVEEKKISTKKDFQLVENHKLIENLSYVFTGEITAKNITNLFTQLSAYFEIGFLLKLNELTGQHRPIQAFAFQQNLTLPTSLRAIRLPESAIFTVLISNGNNMLRHFGLTNLDPQKKMNSYLIHLSDDYSFIFISAIAEPWASLRVETLQKTLMKINFSL